MVKMMLLLLPRARMLIARLFTRLGTAEGYPCFFVPPAVFRFTFVL